MRHRPDKERFPEHLLPIPRQRQGDYNAAMRSFFNTLDSLHQFTLELDRHPERQCRHCAQCHQLVSHGFVYQKQHGGDPQPIGKRILCSNRCGKTGCGRTERLYLTERIPRLRHGASRVFVFICALIAGATIAQAYQQATGCDQPRHAFRWLRQLERALPQHRRYLSRPAPTSGPDPGQRPQRLQLLLPTWHCLFSHPNTATCTHFQHHHQTAFL